MDLPTGLLAGFAQGFQKTMTIMIVGKDVFTAVAPIHEVVDSARILGSEFARHQSMMAITTTLCQSLGPTPSVAS